MNRLNNGTLYRQTLTGYVLERGGRELYITAKSVNAGEKARKLIANISFDKLFKQAKRVPLFTNNQRAIYID